MKKIIFFSKNLKIGGMEKALVSLLNRLVLQYDITLVLEEKSGILLSMLDGKITVKEYRLSKCKISLIRKILNFTKRLFWIIFNKNRYDFSCNYATYSIIGSRLAQIASNNNSLYIHSNYYDMYSGNKEKMDNFFLPHCLNGFRKLIFVSNESKEKFLRVYSGFSDKSIVINNLVVCSQIQDLSQKSINDPFDSKSINLLFVGRLENESKNFDLLIDGFIEVLKKNKNYKLYLIGSGPYKNEIEKKIELAKIQNYVILFGERKNPYPYMKKSDAIVFTSNYEGFPVTYLEALVLGKQILSTVVMSDESIDMRDYVIYMEKDPCDVAKTILKNVKKGVACKSKIDFDKMNNKKLAKIIELIEV